MLFLAPSNAVLFGLASHPHVLLHSLSDSLLSSSVGLSLSTRVSQKKLFFDLSFVLLTTHAIGLEEPTKKFSAL